MTVTLYNTTSQPNQMTKTLVNGTNINIQLKAPTNVISPEIVLKNVAIDGYNYCYIPDFKRYYFIADKDTVYADITTRKLSVDVLMSFSADIKQGLAFLDRQETQRTLLLENASMPNYAETKKQTFVFPNNPLNTLTAILMVNSGAVI